MLPDVISAPQRAATRRSASFGARLGLMAITLTLLLAILLSVVVGQISTAFLADDIGVGFAELAYQMADKLDQALTERATDVELLSADATLRDPGASLGAKRAVLERAQRLSPEVAWLGFAETTGTVRYSTGGLLEGSEVQARPWFQQAQRGSYLGDVHEALLLASLLPSSSGQPLRFVDIAVPVYDDSNRFVGVLGAHLYVRWAESMRETLFRPLEQRRNLELLILSQSGELVLSTGADAAGALPALSELELGAERSGYLVQQGSSGTSFLTGYARADGMAGSGGLGWTVVVRQPTERAFAPVHRLQSTILLIGGSLGLLFGAAAWLLARRSAAPLLRIASAAERVRQGDRSVTLPVFRGASELRVLSETISDLVTTLTHHEANTARLYEAERKERLAAEAAVETREQFLSVASHELKTPLTVLLGQAQLLQRRVSRGTFDPAKQAQTAATISAQALRLDTMIGEMLDLSRLQQGQFRIERAPLDLAAVVERVVTELRQTSERHTIMLEISERPLPVLGDELRLEQVLYNLLHNAVKYSPTGGAIQVTGARRGADITIAIADRGIGIPPQNIARLFERFYRAENVDESQISGFGIGLFVCNEIVTRHGGTIDVSSVEGQGSTFVVCLPADDGAPPAG